MSSLLEQVLAYHPDEKDYKESVKGFRGEYRFLSNFHPTRCYYKGKIYPSSEHLYVHLKTVGIPDEAFFISGGDVKRLGRELPLNPNMTREEAMLVALTSKYSDQTMLGKLLQTKGMYLEETNWWGDIYWGVSDKYGVPLGENRLGKMLMWIRDVWSVNKIFSLQEKSDGSIKW
ncbi:hypothetical protein [Pseudoalteromonas phage J2-1_QLiu-2017]|nr:hypothetical protein [Pseudoalteromonas phage J2-1_QLiu-2017]